MRSVNLVSLAAILWATMLTGASLQAAPTIGQKLKVRSIKGEIDKAGQMFVSGDYRAAADALKEAQAKLQALAADADDELVELIRPQYKRLQNAHGLLELEGIKLPRLGELKATATATTTTPAGGTSVPPPAMTGVSFASEVAPILNRRCGGCHVRKAQGGFSLADYATLMKGPKEGLVVFSGDPLGSRLIEVIEGGEMPPNGNGIPAPELTKLKEWISEGAKFDGDSETTNLARLVPASEVKPVEVVKATGDESVSFARHIAPMLLQNCLGCHVEPTQQARGGLNMTTFEGLMRGGDNGSPVMAGNAAQSLLVMKLKGTAGGQRMPVGGSPLPDGMIARVEEWINNGAKFDGMEAGAAIKDVAAYARAQMSTHEQLAEDRLTMAEQNWGLSMSGVKSDQLKTENFFFIGNIGASAMEDYAKEAETLVPQIATILRAPTDKPLIKGRMTMYLFRQRYDYSEFGNMIERRKLPSSWKGHWRFSGVDAYGAVQVPRNDDYSVPLLMSQQFAATYVASMGKEEPPKWFSDGVGRVIASKLNAEDVRVVSWNESLRDVVAKMSTPDDFLTGKLSPEESGIAGFSYVRFLMADSAKFNRLLTAIKRGQSFNQSFSEIYGGSPAQLTVAWLKKASRRR